MIASGSHKKTREKEKTTDKVPGPSTSDNRQPTSNNQPEVPETTDLAQPSTSASGDTSCLETGAGQEERSQPREFQTANKGTQNIKVKVTILLMGGAPHEKGKALGTRLG